MVGGLQQQRGFRFDYEAGVASQPKRSTNRDESDDLHKCTREKSIGHPHKELPVQPGMSREPHFLADSPSVDLLQTETVAEFIACCASTETHTRFTLFRFLDWCSRHTPAGERGREKEGAGDQQWKLILLM
ncbi:hypothetical protein SRHO_G00087180 [Serrasalmus rhombeus]